MVQGWADRTPDGFTMHVKAFGLMTRHPVKLEVLPEDLQGAMPVDERGRVDRPPRELRGEVFRRFLEALDPLRTGGKLGGILFQLPSYSSTRTARSNTSSGRVSSSAATRCSSSSGTVVARRGEPRCDAGRSSSGIGAAYVTVDAPKSDTAKNLVPTVPAVTTGSRTSASTAATSGRGTSAAARRRSASTTSTPTKSSRSGCRRCRSSRGSRKRRTRSSTTTRASEDRKNPLGRISQAAATRSSCGACWM